MKKILLTLIIAAFAAALPFDASAYSKEMEQLAQELNGQLAGQDELQQISYDGTNLIMTFQKGFMNDEEEAMMESVTDAESLKPVILEYLGKGGLDKQSMQMFGQILGMFDTNLLIRMPLSSGKNIDITFSPADLSNL